MNKVLTFGTIAYCLVLAGCVFAYTVQFFVIDSQRQSLSRRVNGPYLVEIREKGAATATEVELRLVDTSLASQPLSLTNELEEHLLSLLVANLATGVFLVFAVLMLSRQAARRESVPSGVARDV